MDRPFTGPVARCPPSPPALHDAPALDVPPPASAPDPSQRPPGPHPTDAGRRPDQVRTVRRIVAGVVLGALTMFAVATLDTFAGATVPVLGTFAALPAPDLHSPQVVEVPAPPSAAGHLPELVAVRRRRRGRSSTARSRTCSSRRARSDAHRPAHAARRPAVAPAGEGAVHPGRAELPRTPSSTPTAGTGSARSSRRRRSGPRATASCAAGCRARPSPAPCTR